MQKDLERITLTFFLLKQSNIFCMVISQTVVDICGRDRKGRQFFLEVGQEIRLLTRSAISRHLRVLSGTRKLEPLGVIWVAYETRDGVRMRVVYQPVTGKVITAFSDDAPISSCKPIR